MAISKIILNGVTQMDLTQDTVVASNLISPNTAHRADGEAIIGTASDSGGEYTRTIIAPQQTVTPNSSRIAQLSNTTPLVDGKDYIVTLDGVEWFTTSETLWMSNYIIGDPNWFLNTPSDYIYPFGVGTEGSTTEVAFPNTSQHTIKIERLDFVTGGTTLTTKTITQNGTYNASSDSADGYSSVIVNVSSSSPTIQSLTVTPSETEQTFNSSSVDGYKPVTVGAISSTYVGSGITRCSSTDLTTSGATVSVPAGYYSAAASKSVASGSVTGPLTISGSTANVSTGTNTLTLTKTVSVTPTVTAGYISAGTAGDISVSLTASVTTKAAATITPGTTNQTIASGTYLTGTQTISGDANLVASNIVSGVQIFGVTGNVVLQNYYTGSSAPSSSLGSNGDLYLQT